MADDILELSLKIDKSTAEADLNNTTSQIVALKTAQDQLNTLYKNGAVSQEQYTKQSALNKAAMSELNAEQKANVKILDSQSGSIKELGALLASNKAAYQNLTKEQRDNKEIGGAMLKVIQDQDTEYKKLQMSIGNTSVNVGNYKKDVQAALSETGLLGTQGGKSISMLGGAFSSVKSGVQAGVKAFGTLRGAIASTGIGLIIIAISALVEWFKKSSEGSKALAMGTAALHQIFSILSGVLVKVGDFLVMCFTKPKEAIHAIGEFIQSQITNRIEGIKKSASALGEIFSGNFKQGLKDLGSGLLEAETGIKNLEGKTKAFLENVKKQAEAAAALEERRRNLIKETRIEEEKEAETQRSISKLRDEAMNKEKSREDRLKALQQADNLELANMAAKRKLAREDLAITQQQIELNQQAGVKNDASLLDELSQKRTKLTQTETEYYDNSRKLKKSEIAIDQQIKAEEQKIQEDKEKNLLAHDQETYKITLENLTNNIAQRNKLLDQERTDNLKKLSDQYAKGLISEQLYNEGKIKIDNDYNKNSDAQTLENLQKKLEYIKANSQDIAAIEKELNQENEKRDLDRNQANINVLQEKLKLAKENEQNQIQVENEIAQQTIKIETDKNQKIIQANENLAKEIVTAKNEEKQLLDDIAIQENKNNDQRRYDDLQKTMDAEKAKINALKISEEQKNKLLIELDQDYAAKKKVIDDELNKSHLDAVKNSLTSEAQAVGEHTVLGKAASIAATTINTFEAAESAFKSLSGIPIVGVPLGIAAAAAAVAMGLKNVQQITAVQTPQPKKYESGGWIDGASHSNGGVNANLQGGEFVVNATTMKNPQMASQIVAMNQAGNQGKINSSPGIDENRIAEIAATVVKSIPVQVKEHDITLMQNRVQVRESNFSM